MNEPITIINKDYYYEDMVNENNFWNGNKLLTIANVLPKKAPEPERKVELWIDGKPLWIDFEMKVLCMFYMMTGNPEVESVFSAEDIQYAAFNRKEMPTTFNEIRVRTLDGETVCECTGLLQHFLNNE